MWLDIIVLVIIILSMALGYRNGFVYSILHGAGWILSIAVSFLLFPHIVRFLNIYSANDSVVGDRIILRFEESLSTLNLNTDGSIPNVIVNYISDILDNLAVTATQGIAVISLNIVIFIMLLCAIKLLSMFLVNLFSKKSKLSLTGSIDGILGLASGGLKGVLIVFILLALILPISLLIGESFRLFMESALYSSIYTKTLYDNNLLLLIVKSTLFT